MPNSRSEKIQLVMGATMAAVGTMACIAPRRFAQTSGPATAETEHLTRMWALRETALGAILLGARRADSKSPVLLAVAGLAAAEVIVSLRTPGLSAPSRASTAATATAFAAASGYAWRTQKA